MFNQNRPSFPGQQQQRPTFSNAPNMPSPFMNNLMQGNGIPPPWSSGTFMPPGQSQSQGQPFMTPPNMPSQAQGMMPQAFPGQGTGTGPMNFGSQGGQPSTFPGQGTGIGPSTWSPGGGDARIPQMNPMMGGGRPNLPGLAGAIQGMQPGFQRPVMNPQMQDQLRMIIQNYLSQIRGY